MRGGPCFILVGSNQRCYFRYNRTDNVFYFEEEQTDKSWDVISLTSARAINYLRVVSSLNKNFDLIPSLEGVQDMRYATTF